MTSQLYQPSRNSHLFSSSVGCNFVYNFFKLSELSEISVYAIRWKPAMIQMQFLHSEVLLQNIAPHLRHIVTLIRIFSKKGNKSINEYILMGIF